MIIVIGHVSTGLRRYVHTAPAGKKDLAALLRSSIAAVKLQKEDIQKNASDTIKVTPPQAKKPPKQLPADYLNTKYRSEFSTPPTVGQLAEINGFFHHAQVKLEWTTANFLDIPGEKQRQEHEEQMNAKSESEVEETEEAVKKAPVALRSVGLPEVVFLGKCNVGKSSLLNGLLTESQLRVTHEFAFASKRAGFTQTMNCFNIGNRFKLIDTPGYGVKGKPEQGKQVMEYLRRRKELRRVYLLVGSKDGFSLDDFTIIDYLVESGVPFEIVFTKVDQLMKVSKVEKHIKESGVKDLPSEPSLIFTSAETSRKIPKRQGFSELRTSIFEACDLAPGIKPLKLSRK